MEPVDVIEGDVSVLDRADVDTDQIIPKQFLKRVERTGFGEFLFYDWLRDGEIELEPNPILVSGAELRLRLLAGARRLGARRLRLQGRDRAVVLRHLLRQLDEERAAPGRPPGEHCRGIAEAGRGADRPRRPDRRLRRRRGPLRGRGGHQAPPARRPRRDLDHAAERRGDRRLRGALTRIAGPSRRRRSEPAVPARHRETGTPATYDRVSGPQVEWAAAASSTRLGLAATRSCSTPAAAAAGSPSCCSSALPRGTRDRGRRLGGDGRGGAGAARSRRSDADPLRPARARPRRSRRRRLLQRRLPLDPRPRAALPAAAARCCAPAGGSRRSAAGAGNVADFDAAVEAVAAETSPTEPPPMPSIHTTSPPPRRPRRSCRGRLRGRRCGLVGLAGQAARAARVHPHRLPRRPLGALPEELREPFLDEVAGRLGPEPELDYVRLNISARKGAAPAEPEPPLSSVAMRLGRPLSRRAPRAARRPDRLRPGRSRSRLRPLASSPLASAWLAHCSSASRAWPQTCSAGRLGGRAGCGLGAGVVERLGVDRGVVADVAGVLRRVVSSDVCRRPVARLRSVVARRLVVLSSSPQPAAIRTRTRRAATTQPFGGAHVVSIPCWPGSPLARGRARAWCQRSRTVDRTAAPYPSAVPGIAVHRLRPGSPGRCRPAAGPLRCPAA